MGKLKVEDAGCLVGWLVMWEGAKGEGEGEGKLLC